MWHTALRESLPPRHRHRAGFTIIELMIVAVVIAIAATIVIPMARNSGSSQLRGAAELLASDLDYARILAMQSSADPVVVVVDVDAETYLLAHESDMSTPIKNPATGAAYRVAYTGNAAYGMDKVRIDSIDFGGATELSYAAFGSPQNGSDATITLSASSKTVTVTVDGSTGSVSIGQIQ